jgi:signal transduction histidine kinase
MVLSKLNSIAARIAIAIVLAIILVLALGTVLAAGFAYYDGGRVHIRFSRSGFGVINPNRNQMMLAGKIALMVRAVASSPRPERQRIIAALAEPAMQVALDAPLIPGAADGVRDENLDWLRQLIQMQLDEASPPLVVSVRRSLISDDKLADPNHSALASPERLLEVTLPDDQRVSISLSTFPATTRYGMLQLLSVILVAAVIVAFWTARWLARPIREFARATERLGVDLTAPPLAVRGPQELRTTIQAFNRMQDRLRRFLGDRTQMLAAISHDLRAPLARLRLRAEFVEDEEQQRKMFGELATMNAMIDSTLAFARDATRQEPRKLVDLSVLVEDVCEDVTDSGGAALYQGPRGIAVTCRPSDMRRAITNLVDNAVKYGGSAHVDMLREDKRVVIVIDDEGPGIPLKEHERVFAPFYRLEPSRDPGNGGVGLGLSVARTIIREHGGEITLANREGGGLSVRVELPAEAGARPDITAADDCRSVSL